MFYFSLSLSPSLSISIYLSIYLSISLFLFQNICLQRKKSWWKKKVRKEKKWVWRRRGDDKRSKEDGKSYFTKKIAVLKKMQTILKLLDPVPRLFLFKTAFDFKKAISFAFIFFISIFAHFFFVFVDKFLFKGYS